ncbi:Rieske (2Fe-2S) protein [Solwaraspora sp. WMMD1047]|uniref:Rieske 2Fe-2S domain-containing protein n=1 Tax=Solwaraspora sp. WMMD1047 TaxID=3016102 RepID=UPI002415A51D|nr:Rieske (2Fe-2S) protein [Solwaraspora sp. WMMD1047]MDG4827830.1 Rieske (2Fe-2S) protein [Solwaraspora sp. WMMD1047]
MRAALTRIERAARLDGAADQLQRRVWSTFRSQRVRDLLHGVWLGHPLHPALAQVPIGAWTSAAILDLLPGPRRPATVLVAVGVAAAVPAAAAGANDWAELSRDQRRVGLVHAAANAVGTVCYAGSLVARLAGRHRAGRTLGFLGLAAVNGGAYLGGHLAYKQAAGVNQGVPELHQMSDGWRPVADLAAIPEATLVTRKVDDVAVVVYRDGDEVTVMLERCAHQGGPLGSGEVARVDGRTCVICPWHGSTFELGGGEVIHGPAGTDQQVLPTRVIGGTLHTRLP